MNAALADRRTPSSWTVLIIEREVPAAQQMQHLLGDAGFMVLTPVGEIRHAIAPLTRESPDVLVVDAALVTDDDAYDAMVALAEDRHVPVVYVSSSTDVESVERAARGHGHGYVVRPFSGHQLVSTVVLAILSARRSRTATPQLLVAADRLRAIASVLEDVAQQATTEQVEPPQAPGADSPAATAVAALSPREREIVSLIGNGARVQSIATELGLSTNTVRNHLKAIYRKLKLRGQHELYDFWRRTHPDPANDE